MTGAGIAVGRKMFEPTKGQQDLVTSLAAFGVPEEDICLVIENESTGKPIAPKTLRKHFRRELSTAKIKANAKVAESLFTKATGNGKGAVLAAIFWLKTQAGWKETARLEHTGPNGAPIQTTSIPLEKYKEARKQILDDC